jgi:hypothetical protein
MTIKSPFAKCLSGAVLLLVFLVFMAISGAPGPRQITLPGNNVPTLVATVAEPITLRNSTDPNTASGFCLKAMGPCLLLALFSYLMDSNPDGAARALVESIPHNNPFYIVITTNAP